MSRIIFSSQKFFLALTKEKGKRFLICFPSEIIHAYVSACVIHEQLLVSKFKATVDFVM